MGIEIGGKKAQPLVLHTSGGTTGMPRPMLYTPQDRETMAILGARRYAMQGMRPGDKVLAALSLGLSNGGFALRDTIWKYIGAIPVMTGGGNTTATRRQIEIMKNWGIDIICSFPAYLRHMAIVARDELNIEYLGIQRPAECDERPCHVLRRPRYPRPEEDGISDLTIWIDAETRQQVRSVMFDSRGKLLGSYTFSDIRINPEWPANTFKRASLK